MTISRISTYAATASTVTNSTNAWDGNNTTYALHRKNVSSGTSQCDWSGFTAVTISSGTLYVEYSWDDPMMMGSSMYWEYSLNNGSSWIYGGDTNGSVTLSSGQDISQVKVRTWAQRYTFYDDELGRNVSAYSSSLLYDAWIDYTSGPSVSGVSPNPFRPGEPVTLTGTGFTSGMIPYVDNSTYGTFTGSIIEFNGSTNVAVSFPACRWTTGGGVRLGSSSAYSPVDVYPCHTSSINATRARRGTSLTLTGMGYYTTAVNHVYFVGGGVQVSSFTINSPTSITVTIPSGATTGYVHARNQWNEAAYAATNLIIFYVSHNTSSGKLTSSINIFGDGFINVSSVQINGTACSYTVDSNTQITATVPDAGLPDNSNVSVVTDLGTEYSGTTFTPIKPLTQSISAATVNVGDYVTLTGVYFSNNGALLVMWPNSVSSTAYVISDTQVYTYVPAGAAGSSGAAYVRNAAGGTGSANVTVRYPPDITSFTPSSGRFNQPITINGTHFELVDEVRLNGEATGFTYISATQLRIDHPDASGYISVIGNAGSDTSATQFTFLPPNITSISPNPAAVGSSINITGTNLNGSQRVLFAGGAWSDDYDNTSDTSIYQVTVPNGATSGTVVVQDYGSNSGTGFNLTVTATPSVTGGPTSGRTQRSYTFTGTNLNLITYCDFGGFSHTITAQSATSITLTVDPDTETTTEITFGYSGGSTTYPFEVLYPWAATADLTTVKPGDTLTVTGLRFDPEAVVVLFQAQGPPWTSGSNPPTILSDTTLTVVVPTLPPGTYRVLPMTAPGFGEGAVFVTVPPNVSHPKKSAANCRI